MELIIDKKYLEIPVGAHARNKKLLFFKGDELVFDIDAAIDTVEPDYSQYISLEMFHGQKLTVKSEPEVPELEFNLKMTDTLQEDIKALEKYRPRAHFSSRRGWINDPNGLYYHNGVYHMFFQHNPVDRNWGNMTWGHAVSTDLLHWEQKDCALYPDRTGTMYSGSAIVDKNNVTGLKENENDVALLFYTAAGDKSELSRGVKFTQCMAYSTDGGRTFKKYDKNPVVSHIEAENRDPKVIYCPETKSYIMALYLDGNRYQLYSSENLLDWKPMQQLVLPEDAECPDFYPLPVEGGHEKWIFSGASDRYLVGDIINGKFEPCQPPKRLHYGANSYAAQTFSNIEDRVVRIAWNTTEVPGSYFNKSMCFPTEMTLRKINGEFFLCSYPIREIEKISKNIFSCGDLEVSEGRHFSQPLNTKDAKAFDIDLLISADANSCFDISLLGMNINVDMKNNLIIFLDRTMPICLVDKKVKLRILADTLGLEIFAGYGQAFMCTGFLSDYTLNKFEIKSRNGRIPHISCKIAELRG